MPPPGDSFAFLRLATWFEGGLLVLACILGWLTGIDPFQDLRFGVQTLIWVPLGTVPLYLFFLASIRLRSGGLQEIQRFLVEKLGPFLAALGVGQLAYLALLAGVTEETLFRGFLQPWMESHWGWAAGLIGSNLLFALAHAISPLYALLAGAVGVYLGLVLDFGGERNLLTPLLVHALYDFLAFLAVAQAYRAGRSRLF
jgi:membrane protease YdiL (CAAX protease family)